jgi:hypothetical protein
MHKNKPINYVPLLLYIYIYIYIEREREEYLIGLLVLLGKLTRYVAHLRHRFSDSKTLKIILKK